MHARVVHTDSQTYIHTHIEIYTLFQHQWGNPCLSVSSVLSVLLCLCTHCNSVWSWLLLCHSHIHACTVTNTQTHCNCVKSIAKEILGEKTDSRHKLRRTLTPHNDDVGCVQCVNLCVCVVADCVCLPQF